MYVDENTADYYTIGQICVITGLTDRTVRSYISMGILKGKKINGAWHFSPEEVDDFVSHPLVRPSLQAKRNGYVYDFMMNPAQKQDRCCMILDFPTKDKKAISGFFCHTISTEDYHDIDFSYDGAANAARVILRGDTAEVLRLINHFYNQT